MNRLPRQYAKLKHLCEKLGLDYPRMVDRLGSPPSGREGVGVTLRLARVKKGLTQEQAARLAGIDPGTLAWWEKSDHEPPPWMGRKLTKLHRILGLGQ